MASTDVPPIDKKKCVCHICNKSFASRYNLQRHATVVHGGDKSFKCTEAGCNNTFAYNRDLLVHKTKCHGDGQTLKCKSCDKVFMYRSSWKRHRQSCSATEKSKVKCSACGKLFKTSDSLRHHLKYVHEKKNLRGVQCDLCGRLFNRPQALGRHMNGKFHKGDK
jgi:uncharacterized Zn-finger protein